MKNKILILMLISTLTLCSCGKKEDIKEKAVVDGNITQEEVTEEINEAVEPVEEVIEDIIDENVTKDLNYYNSNIDKIQIPNNNVSISYEQDEASILLETIGTGDDTDKLYMNISLKDNKFVVYEDVQDNKGYLYTKIDEETIVCKSAIPDDEDIESNDNFNTNPSKGIEIIEITKVVEIPDGNELICKINSSDKEQDIKGCSLVVDKDTDEIKGINLIKSDTTIEIKVKTIDNIEADLSIFNEAEEVDSEQYSMRIISGMLGVMLGAATNENSEIKLESSDIIMNNNEIDKDYKSVIINTQGYTLNEIQKIINNAGTVINLEYEDTLEVDIPYSDKKDLDNKLSTLKDEGYTFEVEPGYVFCIVANNIDDIQSYSDIIQRYCDSKENFEFMSSSEYSNGEESCYKAYIKSNTVDNKANLTYYLKNKGFDCN